MVKTPSSSSKLNQTQTKTPQSKHRLNFITKENPPPGEHPVEVIGRIRNYPSANDKKENTPISFLHINPENKTVRVRADIGYRVFSLDGVSSSEEEDLDAFYKKFIESRINGVKSGAKCTVMMYGPTGSGKSHTMFGCSKQPGIVYRSLKGILGDNGDHGIFVQVTVLEIYNEEIYDLLPSNGGGFVIGWPKSGNGYKVKLEVMGKKVKNATFICGNEAGKISKEIQKVEKRRIVKSTLCNERSSRSHCMIILDVPTVGGRLMLVDMAGSENIDQAGQIGFEAKMQTAKINQGNIALKRVVESIANGDSHVPFRDSKLTMLLQDSFEDTQSKILMILCASPDPKEIHKTVCTLEYGSKAKCIVRGPHTTNKDIHEDSSSAVILGLRLEAMDQFIHKLQMENKLREKERNEAHKELLKKEKEAVALRALVERKGSGATEEEINAKVNERTRILELKLEKELGECRRKAEEFVEMERRRMEERVLQQQEEVEMLRRRLQEKEFELCRLRDGNEVKELDDGSSSFAKRLIGIYGDEIPGMVKSMDLDMGDPEPVMHEVEHDGFALQFGPKTGLCTVYEEEEIEEDEEDEEVEKLIVEEKVCSSEMSESSPLKCISMPTCPDSDTESSRLLRIQNMFTLCGNQREVCQHIRSQTTAETIIETIDSHWSQVTKLNKENEPAGSKVASLNEKENNPYNGCTDAQFEVGVKWEASKVASLNEKENNPYNGCTDAQFEVGVKWEASKENTGKCLPLSSLPSSPMKNRLPLSPNNSVLVSR